MIISMYLAAFGGMAGGIFLIYSPPEPRSIYYVGYAHGQIATTKVEAYYNFNGALSAQNPVSVVVWVTPPEWLSLANVTRVRVLFEGAIQYPSEEGNPTPTGTVDLSLRTDRKEKVWYGTTKITYPLDGEYHIAILISANQFGAQENTDGMYPRPIRVQTLETTIALKNSQTTIGLTYFAGGMAVLQVGLAVISTSSGRSTKSKEEESDKVDPTETEA